MNDNFKNHFAEARKMLAEATRLNGTAKYGTAMKLAFEASEYVAAGYLSAMKGQEFTPNDANFDLFAKGIREPERHPAQLQNIRDAVSKVRALREAYEPALLDETTQEDAQQMIECVAGVVELVEQLL